jgi:hypothetical protein
MQNSTEPNSGKWRTGRKVAYYMGAGLDLQPILRLSHLCDYFFYVTVGTTPEQVSNSIREAVDNINRDVPGLLNLTSEENQFDLSERLLTERRLMKPPAYFTRRIIQDYMNAFRPFMDDKPFVKHFQFESQAAAGRIINLFYLGNMEGLATYQRLFLNDDALMEVPDFFISIQSGAFEQDVDLSDRFFWFHKRMNKPLPKVWIKGSWIHEPVAEGRYYTREVGEFRNWNGALGLRSAPLVHPRGLDSKVKAYGLEAEWEEQFEPLIFESEGLKLRLIHGKVNRSPETRAAYDLIAYNNEERGHWFSNPQIREMLISVRERRLIPILFREQLKILYLEYCDFAEKHPDASFYRRQAIPKGLECETLPAIEAFLDYFQRVNDVAFHLDCYIKSPLDFIQELPGIQPNADMPMAV